MIALLLLSFLLGGLGRRMAGGGFQELTGLDVGDLPTRAFFGATLASATFLGGVHSLWVLTMVITGMLGCSISMFDCLSMGREPARSWATDALGATKHGVLSMAITSLGMLLVAFLSDYHYIGANFIVLVVAGFTMAPMYELGWQLYEHRIIPRWPFVILGQPTTVGEFTWGGMCGVGAFLAGVLG